MLGPTAKDGRRGKLCRQAIIPAERASVRHVRTLYLECRGEHTVRLCWHADAQVLGTRDVVGELKIKTDSGYLAGYHGLRIAIRPSGVQESHHICV